DVRLTWKVLLNGKELGRLAADENDTVIYLPVPAGRLLAGENTLTIEQVGKASDDIRVGEIILQKRPVGKALSEAAVYVTVHDARGFAYGLDSVRLTVKPGEVVKQTLAIRREVPLKGYVSCDTHVHTLTYSGHGDCTLDERVLTIAGENIELPIATDHNVQVD